MPNEIVAGLMLSIDGNTVRLRKELDVAQAAIRKTGKEMKEAMAETRASVTEAKASIALLGEEIGVHLDRHLRGFVAKLPGVAPLMSAAFSAVAIVGVGVAIVEAGKKLYDFYEKEQRAAHEAGRAIQDLAGSLHLANLEHEVRLAKMDEEIAKLEHKPGDGLKTALAEARAEAFKLGEELRKDVEEARKLIDGKISANWFEKVALGMEGSGGTLDKLDDYERGLEAKASIVDPSQRAAELKAYAAKKLDDLHEEITARKRLQELQKTTPYTSGPSDPGLGSEEYDKLSERFGVGDQSKVLLSLNAFHAMVQEQYQRASDDQAEIQKAGALKRAEGNRDAELEAKRHLEEIKRDTQDRMKALEDELNLQINAHTKSLSEERDYWKSKLYAGSNLGDPINALILAKMAPLTQRLAQEGKSDDKEWAKVMADLQDKADKQTLKDSPFDLDRAEQKNKSQDDAAGMAAMKEHFWLVRETAMAQDELNAKEAVQDGQMRKGQEAIIAQANALEKLRHELEELQAKRAAAVKMQPEYRKPEDNPAVLQNQIDMKQSQIDLGSQTLNYDKKQQTFRASMDSMFDEWIERTTDLRSAVKLTFDTAMNSVNDAIMKDLTQRDHRGAWKDAGKQIFTSASRSGLQMAEGSIMGAMGLAHGKLGTKSNPMYTKSADGSGSGGVPALLSNGSGSGEASTGDSSTMSNILGGVFQFAKFAGFMAEGGVMQPGGFYLTGEKGPELMRVGSSSRISNARDTARLMSGGSTGDTHHHYNIDARGATDPAAIKMAVQRGIAQAAPHIIGATIAVQRDQDRRKPNQG